MSTALLLQTLTRARSCTHTQPDVSNKHTLLLCEHIYVLLLVWFARGEAFLSCSRAFCSLLLTAFNSLNAGARSLSFVIDDSSSLNQPVACVAVLFTVSCVRCAAFRTVWIKSDVRRWPWWKCWLHVVLYYKKRGNLEKAHEHVGLCANLLVISSLAR